METQPGDAESGVLYPGTRNEEVRSKKGRDPDPSRLNACKPGKEEDREGRGQGFRSGLPKSKYHANSRKSKKKRAGRKRK